MGIAVGTTVFVLGSIANGNREVLTFEDGQDYGELPVSAITAYSADATEFPVL